jgi:hypothetical protein
MEVSPLLSGTYQNDMQSSPFRIFQDRPKDVPATGFSGPFIIGYSSSDAGGNGSAAPVRPRDPGSDAILLHVMWHLDPSRASAPCITAATNLFVLPARDSHIGAAESGFPDFILPALSSSQASRS